MKKEVFEKGINILGRQFPEKTLDVEILWSFLKDLSDEQYIDAIKQIVSSNTEINKATNMVALMREKALCKDLQTAGEAWGLVMKAVSRIGSYGVPKFQNIAIQKCVDSIGWRNICLSENPMIERAHFLKIYDVMAEREKNNILSSPIKLLTEGVAKKLAHETNLTEKTR